VFPIVGTRSETHLDEALRAADLQLTSEQIAWLEAGARG
jgi:aryl-alcohol dehydrogenase-like predicted oxidoreductase